MKNDGGPAFPTEFGFNSEGEKWDRRGMSLRDWFAGMALQGIMTGVAVMGASMEPDEPVMRGPIAHDAYKVADAMISERDKP